MRVLLHSDGLKITSYRRLKAKNFKFEGQHVRRIDHGILPNFYYWPRDIAVGIWRQIQEHFLKFLDNGPVLAKAFWVLITLANMFNSAHAVAVKDHLSKFPTMHSFYSNASAFIGGIIIISMFLSPLIEGKNRKINTDKFNKDANFEENDNGNSDCVF